MKTSIKLLLVVAVGLLFSQASKAQTAELQVIHNCPDPAADSVDVYVNGMLTLDNFAFRTATSFLSLPAGVDINIGIAPKSSASFSDTLVSYTVNLVDGQKYVAIASGVLNPAGFASNPGCDQYRIYTSFERQYPYGSRFRNRCRFYCTSWCN
ncbi:MAG: DUF4397 domain-containing protein [Bacteroidetes bacterium]|nr:DUF4397 domain-containing protein [Bacteroidota bacterium]